MVQVGNLGHHVRLIAHRLDAVQLALEGRDALLVDGRGVHATGEVVADLLVERAAAGLHHGGAFEEAELHLLVVVLQFAETSPAGAVGGQRVLGDPVAAGVLVEIDARIDGLVHGGGVDAPLRHGEQGQQKKTDDDSKLHDVHPLNADFSALRLPRLVVEGVQ